MVKVGEIDNDEFNGIHTEYIPTKYEHNQEPTMERRTENVKLSLGFFKTKEMFNNLSEVERDEFIFNNILGSNDYYNNINLKTPRGHIMDYKDSVENMLSEYKENDYSFNNLSKVEIVQGILGIISDDDYITNYLLERQREDLNDLMGDL